ncbi:MAG TPA: Rid family hydrolase [Candidatus Polarisedimenticolia bacterium]|nr:Rid family hydrolase [Candidatus Polarisedimenticolia bacterium]
MEGTGIEISAAAMGTGVVPVEAAAQEAWGRLFEDLRGRGAGARDILVERIFLSDLGSLDAIRTGRALAYASAGVPSPPIVSIVGQPPADPAVPFAVLAHALPGPGPAGGAAATRLEGLPDSMGGVATHAGGARRIILTGIVGGEPGDRLDFEGQAARLFARAGSVLMREGIPFRQVARTWIFLAEIDRDYAALNRARRAFFEASDVRPAPASTGIGGRPAANGRLIALDLVAFDGLQGDAMRPLSAPTMNEAPSYGSDFSRGFEVRLADRRLVFVSGTASIDRRGEVLHPGDIEMQADRMLQNVDRLLHAAGAGFDSLAHAVTYVKRAGDAPAVVAACARAGFPGDVPHIVCVAEVCRAEWLCEMEAFAALPA